MAFVSSHIDLQNCLRFLTRAFVIYLLQDKVRKENKTELPAEKSHNFLMRGIKRIHRHGIVGKLSDNSLSKFQPIWSRGC